MEKSHKSLLVFGGTIILQFSGLLCIIAIESPTEWGQSFYSGLELLVGAGYLAALIYAAVDDIKNQKIEHIPTILILSIIASLLMISMAKLGLIGIIVGMIFAIIFTITPANTIVIGAIASLMGVLGPVIAIIAIIAAVFASTIVW